MARRALFSPISDVISLDQWAIDRDYKDGVQAKTVIADTLNKLLPGMTFSEIDKKRRCVIMNTVDGKAPLRQLSEGYQAMVAWAGDMLYRMSDTHGPLMINRDVLLVDEMDLHLHPV